MSDFSKMKIKLSLSIGYSGARRTDEHKLSDYYEEEDWNAMTQKEQQKALDDIADEWSCNYIDCGVSLVEGE